MKQNFLKIWQPLSIIILCILTILGCIFIYTNIKTGNTSNKQSENTTDIFATNNTEEQTVIFEGPYPEDSLLAYQDNQAYFPEPYKQPTIVYGTNRMMARLSPNNITNTDEEKITIEDNMVKCTMTGYHFDDKSENNIIYVSKYAYDQVIKPLQDAVYNYIKDSGNDIMYDVELTFNDDSKYPSIIEIKGYSIIDSGNTCCFHYTINNINEETNDTEDINTSSDATKNTNDAQ